VVAIASGTVYNSGMGNNKSPSSMGTSKEGLEIMSKGSAPRPLSVDTKTFDNNWDAIFGKKKKTEDATKEKSVDKKSSTKDKKAKK